MKKSYLLYLSLLIVLLDGCITYNRVTTEHDEIKASKKIKLHTEYLFSEEKESSLASLDQKIVREIKDNSTESFTIYDALLLNKNSFPIEDKVYLITDKRHFEIKPLKIYREKHQNIDEEKEDIMTADSSKVTIVTGYKKINNSMNKLVYRIDTKIINEIKKTTKLKFRYYAGHETITIKMNNNKLNLFKKIINQ